MPPLGVGGWVRRADPTIEARAPERAAAPDAGAPCAAGHGARAQLRWRGGIATRYGIDRGTTWHGQRNRGRAGLWVRRTNAIGPGLRPRVVAARPRSPTRGEYVRSLSAGGGPPLTRLIPALFLHNPYSVAVLSVPVTAPRRTFGCLTVRWSRTQAPGAGVAMEPPFHTVVRSARAGGTPLRAQVALPATAPGPPSEGRRP